MIDGKYRSIVKEVSNEYYKVEKSGFNFFETISDTFYRENFHSDILQSLLQIEEFYLLFIEKVIIDKTQLVFFNFNAVRIEREKGRIDISIINDHYKKVIIIENKINNAGDTHRQLPKYIEYIESFIYEVSIVIYLSMDGNKIPSKNDWTEEEKIKLKTLFKSMSAMKLSDKVSLEEILNSVINSISNIDHIVFIRQYLKLLKQLSKEKTNYNIMEKFYNEIKTKQDLDELISIKRLINDLPKFRAARLKNKFENNHNPFEEALIWKDTTMYFNTLIINESNFALDIDCYENYYDVSLFDRNCKDNSTTLELIKNTEIELQERENSDRLYSKFSFPEEEEQLELFINKVINELSKLK
jgi:hypothetical protein